MRAVRTLALAAVLLMAAAAHAQSAECAEDWSCWLTPYNTPGTILGVRITLTQVDHGSGVEHGFLTAYSTELYTTLDHVTGHFALAGAIGGGSAGNEGGIGGTLDFGMRANVTPTSGPFVRIALDGSILGNDALYLSMFEPAQGRVGYQLLDGDTLLEGGVIAGYLPVGRFDAAAGTRDLSDTAEVGLYGAVHLRPFRADARFAHLPADASAPRTAVNLLRVALCSYPRPLALCADLLYVHADALFGMHGARTTSAVYSGFTLGLTP
jgi:hypothetical protein